MFRENGVRDIRDLKYGATTHETYPGKNYLAASVNYEWHPLVVTDIFAMINLDDQSWLLTGTMKYSISDEADLLFGGVLALGDAPGTKELPGDILIPELRSEFGSYPDSLFIELRFYL